MTDDVGRLQSFADRPTDRRTDRDRVIVRLLLNAHIIHVDNAKDL